MRIFLGLFCILLSCLLLGKAVILAFAFNNTFGWYVVATLFSLFLFKLGAILILKD